MEQLANRGGDVHTERHGGGVLQSYDEGGETWEDVLSLEVFEKYGEGGGGEEIWLQF